MGVGALPMRDESRPTVFDMNVVAHLSSKYPTKVAVTIEQRRIP